MSRSSQSACFGRAPQLLQLRWNSCYRCNLTLLGYIAGTSSGKVGPFITEVVQVGGSIASYVCPWIGPGNLHTLQLQTVTTLHQQSMCGLQELVTGAAMGLLPHFVLHVLCFCSLAPDWQLKHSDAQCCKPSLP